MVLKRMAFIAGFLLMAFFAAAGSSEQIELAKYKFSKEWEKELSRGEYRSVGEELVDIYFSFPPMSGADVCRQYLRFPEEIKNPPKGFSVDFYEPVWGDTPLWDEYLEYLKQDEKYNEVSLEKPVFPSEKEKQREKRLALSDKKKEQWSKVLEQVVEWEQYRSDKGNIFFRLLDQAEENAAYAMYHQWISRLSEQNKSREHFRVERDRAALLMVWESQAWNRNSFSEDSLACVKALFENTDVQKLTDSDKRIKKCWDAYQNREIYLAGDVKERLVGNMSGEWVEFLAGMNGYHTPSDPVLSLAAKWDDKLAKAPMSTLLGIEWRLENLQWFATSYRLTGVGDISEKLMLEAEKIAQKDRTAAIDYLRKSKNLGLKKIIAEGLISDVEKEIFKKHPDWDFVVDTARSLRASKSINEDTLSKWYLYAGVWGEKDVSNVAGFLKGYVSRHAGNVDVKQLRLWDRHSGSCCGTFDHSNLTLGEVIRQWEGTGYLDAQDWKKFLWIDLEGGISKATKNELKELSSFPKFHMTGTSFHQDFLSTFWQRILGLWDSFCIDNSSPLDQIQLAGFFNELAEKVHIKSRISTDDLKRPAAILAFCQQRQASYSLQSDPVFGDMSRVLKNGAALGSPNSSEGTSSAAYVFYCLRNKTVEDAAEAAKNLSGTDPDTLRAKALAAYLENNASADGQLVASLIDQDLRYALIAGRSFVFADTKKAIDVLEDVYDARNNVLKDDDLFPRLTQQDVDDACRDYLISVSRIAGENAAAWSSSELFWEDYRDLSGDGMPWEQAKALAALAFKEWQDAADLLAAYEVWDEESETTWFHRYLYAYGMSHERSINTKVFSALKEKCSVQSCSVDPKFRALVEAVKENTGREYQDVSANDPWVGMLLKAAKAPRDFLETIPSLVEVPELYPELINNLGNWQDVDLSSYWSRHQKSREAAFGVFVAMSGMGISDLRKTDQLLIKDIVLNRDLVGTDAYAIALDILSAPKAER